MWLPNVLARVSSVSILPSPVPKRRKLTRCAVESGSHDDRDILWCVIHRVGAHFYGNRSHPKHCHHQRWWRLLASRIRTCHARYTTIYREAPRPFDELTVAIIGDIKHSRVARSDIAPLKTLGVNSRRGPRHYYQKALSVMVSVSITIWMRGGWLWCHHWSTYSKWAYWLCFVAIDIRVF